MSDKLLDIISSVLLLASFCMVAFSAFRMIECERRFKRNNEVLRFRLWILDHYPEYYDDLPSYEVMFNERRPITIDEYLPELYNKIIEQ